MHFQLRLREVARLLRLEDLELHAWDAADWLLCDQLGWLRLIRTRHPVPALFKIYAACFDIVVLHKLFE